MISLPIANYVVITGDFSSRISNACNHSLTMIATPMRMMVRSNNDLVMISVPMVGYVVTLCALPCNLSGMKHGQLSALTLQAWLPLMPAVKSQVTLVSVLRKVAVKCEAMKEGR